MQLLITGSSGFIGKNLVEQLQNDYSVLHPSSTELNLLNTEQVERYLQVHHCDVIIHTANRNTTRNADTTPYDSLNGNLRMFFNLERCRRYYGKMFYFGSGAEYDSRHYIPNMEEDYLESYIPTDPYGFSKYIMAKHSEQNNNIYDLVLFGVFGKYEEWERRFISNNICKNLQGMQMTIHQNMYFDYIDIDDLVQIMRWFIEHNPKHKRYNICRSNRIDLLSLAQMINQVMGTQTEIVVAAEGYKTEYTGNNARFMKETKWKDFRPFETSIRKLVTYYENSDSSRWFT